MPKVRKIKRATAPKLVYPAGSIAAFAEEYCEWLTIRNYSPQTVNTRRHYLLYFSEWCTERGIIEPGEVTKPIVERYQKWLFQYRKKNGVALSFTSQHSQLVPIRGFFKWLARQNYMPFNPASEIELPKVAKRLPHAFFSVSEAEAVLAAVDVRDWVGVRDRAILETFYSTGMRRKELSNLKIYDLDFERGTVMIREGKGKKDRVVPIGERALLWVRKYLDEVRPRFASFPDEGILYLVESGEAISPNRLTELVRDYITAADIGKKGSCHMFRHTCATLMLEGGADVRFIQQLLGHAELSTTQIYTQVSITALKSIHDATHPGAKLEARSQEEGEAFPDLVAGG